MNTRSKIVTAGELPSFALNRPVVATGYFDVLGPADIAELEALASDRPLVVIVLPLAGEILPQPARAELVAALRVVDYVVAGANPDPCGLLALLQPSRIVRLEEAHLRRRRELIEDVRRRHHV